MSGHLKVQELRDALAEHGLDTSGTKAVLVARLDAYEKDKLSKKRVSSRVDDDPGNGVKRSKLSSDGSEKPVDEYTVVELRAALTKQGLSSEGTKKTLQSRLLEALNSNSNKNLNDDSTCDAQNKKEEEENGDKPSKEGESEKDIYEYSVTQLRHALATRGLPTTGTKKTLQSRLLEEITSKGVINATEKDDGKEIDADKKEEEKEKDDKQPNDEESEKDINDYSVAELRQALAARGLPTTGTKKSLQSRLLQCITSTGVDDATQEDDGKKCDGNAHDKEAKIVTSTKKGRAVLDNHLPDDIKNRFHVLETNQDIYDAMLNQTNVGDNNNKYYVIQVLESDDGFGQYHVYNRWGRVGAKGQDKLFGIFGKDAAISEFESKFFDKTRNFWAQRHNFVPAKNKYTWLERDYSDDAETSEPKQNDKEKPSVPKTSKVSKLDARLAQFIYLICNVDMMKQQMMEIGYDANKMPLGKLSKTTILKGYEALKRIAAVLDGSSKESLERLSSEFYTVIPHDFGYNKMSNFIIDTHPKLKRKLEMVEALGEIQVATKLLEEGEEDEDPTRTSYQRLKCELDPLDCKSEEFQWIKDYLHNTHGKTHSTYSIDIMEVFKATRDGEEERFKKFAKINNRMLLWHGSRLTNWTGILSQGLRIAPPEAPVSGYMFGKGVYFADMASKSANYCCTSKDYPIGVLLLCEVALGEMRELEHSDFHANNLPPGKLSTKGVGGTAPDPKSNKILHDGVIVPMGNPVPYEGPRKGGLYYNEFIVYNVEQIRMRYLLQVKFKHKY